MLALPMRESTSVRVLPVRHHCPAASESTSLPVLLNHHQRECCSVGIRVLLGEHHWGSGTLLTQHHLRLLTAPSASLAMLWTCPERVLLSPESASRCCSVDMRLRALTNQLHGQCSSALNQQCSSALNQHTLRVLLSPESASTASAP